MNQLKMILTTAVMMHGLLAYGHGLGLKFNPIAVVACPEATLYPETSACVKIETTHRSELQFIVFRNQESANAGLKVLSDAAERGDLIRHLDLKKQMYLPSIKFIGKDFSRGEFNLDIIAELRHRCESEQNIGEYVLGWISEKYNCTEQAYIVSRGRSYSDLDSVPTRYGQNSAVNMR